MGQGGLQSTVIVDFGIGEGGVEGAALFVHGGQGCHLGQGTAVGGEFVQVPLQPENGAVLVDERIIALPRHTAAAGGEDQAGFLAQLLQYPGLPCPENIVLIGMPGSGKTTVGKVLAERLGKTFVDADEELVKMAGKPIPEIFAEDGEEVFRAWETKVLEELGKKSGLILSTGGGCVTKERNYPLIHQNGTIFWLKRDLNKLPTDGRPLSQVTPLAAMYEKRRPLYAAFADAEIDNDGTLEATLAQIMEELK